MNASDVIEVDPALAFAMEVNLRKMLHELEVIQERRAARVAEGEKKRLGYCDDRQRGIFDDRAAAASIARASARRPDIQGDGCMAITED